VIYSLFTAVDNPELCRVIPSIPPTSSSSSFDFHILSDSFFIFLFRDFCFLSLLFLFFFLYLISLLPLGNTNMSAIRLLCVLLWRRASSLLGVRAPPWLFRPKHLAHDAGKRRCCRMNQPEHFSHPPALTAIVSAAARRLHHLLLLSFDVVVIERAFWSFIFSPIIW